jgi:hypothetical protein
MTDEHQDNPQTQEPCDEKKLEINKNNTETMPISTSTSTSTSTNVPKFIFIVPYRDRKEHKTFFTIYMKHIMEDIPKTDYEIYFAEQKDARPFNRGGMKNIGFIAMKYKYPNDYKNITFVFNDVDTLPYTKNLFNYETTPGVVKHFYGFKFTLGGIFSIRGADFERINGFPNFWSWGGEDNYMLKRVELAGLYIDRSVFFNILDRNILQMCDGVKKIICRKEAAYVVNMNCNDGLITIKNLNFEIKDEYVNVYFFQTNNDPGKLRFEEQDIVNETRIRLDKKDVTNILERKHNESRTANMVKSGYNIGRPVSAPITPHPHPMQPIHAPKPQNTPSISLQGQPRHMIPNLQHQQQQQQHHLRNNMPMMSANIQRSMGTIGGIGSMGRIRRR